MNVAAHGEPFWQHRRFDYCTFKQFWKSKRLRGLNVLRREKILSCSSSHLIPEGEKMAKWVFFGPSSRWELRSNFFVLYMHTVINNDNFKKSSKDPMLNGSNCFENIDFYILWDIYLLSNELHEDILMMC